MGGNHEICYQNRTGVQAMDRPAPGLHLARRVENSIGNDEGDIMTAAQQELNVILARLNHRALRHDIMTTAQPVLDAPSISRDNRHVMDSLTKAKRVAALLARHGFTVSDVIATRRNARVIIRQPSASAHIKLDAAAIMYSSFSTTMAASIEGVQVEWVIRRVP